MTCCRWPTHAGSRLHGLFTGQSPEDFGQAGAAMQRFAAACQAAGVAWQFRAEIGPAARSWTPSPAATIW